MPFNKPTLGVTTDWPQQLGRLIDMAEGPARRNFIRNGDFQIAQRGTSFAGITAAQYTLDGVLFPGSAGTNTISQEAFTVGQTGVPGNPKNYLRVQRTVAAGAANDLVRFPIEFPARHSGKSVTFSFWAKVASGTKALTLDWVFSGVTPGAYPGSHGSITVTTTWTLFSVTATVEAITAVTANAYIAPRIVESTSLGTFDISIADVQLEEGLEATRFERLNFEQQMDWAQRFLPGIASLGTNHPIGSGMNFSTTQSKVIVPFTARARAAVTGIAVSSASHLSVLDSGASAVACSGVVFNRGGTSCGEISTTVASGLTQGYGTNCFFNSASGYIVFTGAEL